jgi:hypothetical protein
VLHLQLVLGFVVSNLQERLAEIGLDAICLMMDVVVIDVVVEERLARIPPQVIAAVVIYGFGGCNGEQENRLTKGQPRNVIANNRSDHIHQQSFDRVVVKSTVGVGHIESVVDRVDVAVEPASVEEPMHEVLP